jgi:HAD superfamily hydrolase (TIGR01450 family)
MGGDRTQCTLRAIMRPVPSYLRGSTVPLTKLYDVALLDLDGVVYIGKDAVSGAPEALAAARDAGLRLAFVTNNAARTPLAVAEHLTELGIAATAPEVVTSAQAAAHYLADRLPDGARVLVVGTTGLEQAVRERGLVPVTDARGRVDAVVQGYSPEMTWRLLAEGAIAINRGVPWVATNADATVPSPRGRLPGNGSLVAALQHATGAQPVVTGKPDPTMHRESVQRSKAQRPIIVGDRLDTDIEGANAVGCASLLVLTGVTSPHELLAAPPRRRPAYLAGDLRGLLVAHPEPAAADGGVVCGAWRAVCSRSADGAYRLALGPAGDRTDASDVARAEPPGAAGDGVFSRSAAGDGVSSGADDDLDALRAMCAALWESQPPDEHGPAAAVRVECDAADDDSGTAARAVIERLGLGGEAGGT